MIKILFTDDESSLLDIAKMFLEKSGEFSVTTAISAPEAIRLLEKEKIFNRGFGKNTGLGLFLVREILSITGMSILENGETGKGARFEMRVPKGMWRIMGDIK